MDVNFSLDRLERWDIRCETWHTWSPGLDIVHPTVRRKTTLQVHKRIAVLPHTSWHGTSQGVQGLGLELKHEEPS